MRKNRLPYKSYKMHNENQDRKITTTPKLKVLQNCKNAIKVLQNCKIQKSSSIKLRVIGLKK